MVNVSSSTFDGWFHLPQKWDASYFLGFPHTRNMSSYIVYVFLTILTLVAYRIIYNRYFHPLAHIPGPFLESITILARVYQLRKGTIPYYERELHRKYGPVVRIGPNLVASNDPRHIGIIYHKNVDKAAFFDMPGFGLEHGIVAVRDHAEHRWKKRRLMNPVSLED
jgi:hypothetical protein